MIDRRHALSITRQASVLGISRGSVYYLPRPVPAADLALMRRIDELHLDYPFAGSRMLQWLLNAEGHSVGRRYVATLMKKMDIEALYRRPNTSKPAPGHKVYPYLLRNLPVIRPNQVWAMDITYIPMARGFVYLAAVIDWFSRRVLSWALYHAGSEVLHRGRRGSAGPPRQARHLQHRPGQPVHLPRLHQGVEGRRDRHLHGRQRRMARQRLCRASVADRQIRGGLSARLCQRAGCSRGPCPVPDLL